LFGRVRKRDRRIERLLALLSPGSRPNLNALRDIANAIEPLTLNIKQMGYRLARDLAAALPPDRGGEPSPVALKSSLSTQEAIASAWVAYWCGQLHIPVIYHRKIWELCYVLQSIYNADLIRQGSRGLGFGCGTEPIPSYLAAHGVFVTATDLAPARAASRGWIKGGQHTSANEAFLDHLVGREQFDQQVSLRSVDMNAIPTDLTGFDFCWSICALEHLGSIRNGLAFVENSLRTLRPGGMAVHTTEFNIRDDGPTVDNWDTVAFQRKHLEALADRLEEQGHRVAPFDFSLGEGPLDKFIDLPPYNYDLPACLDEWLGPPVHLKLTINGLVTTCAGLIIHKAPA